MNGNTSQRGNFLYNSSTTTSTSASNQQMGLSPFHLNQSTDCFQSDQTHPTVKTEASTSLLFQKFHYPFHHQQHQDQNNESSNEVEAIKAKIIAHPQYSNLLQAYMDCQKVINYLRRTSCLIRSKLCEQD